MLCYAMLCYAMLCYLCYLCHASGTVTLASTFSRVRINHPGYSIDVNFNCCCARGQLSDEQEKYFFSRLSLFAPAKMVSRDGFGRAEFVSRQSAHSPH